MIDCNCYFWVLSTLRQQLHITKISDYPTCYFHWWKEVRQMKQLIKLTFMSFAPIWPLTVLYFSQDDNTYWSWQIRGLASMLTHISNPLSVWPQSLSICHVMKWVFGLEFLIWRKTFSDFKHTRQAIWQLQLFSVLTKSLEKPTRRSRRVLNYCIVMGAIHL